MGYLELLKYVSEIEVLPQKLADYLPKEFMYTVSIYDHVQFNLIHDEEDKFIFNIQIDDIPMEPCLDTYLSREELLKLVDREE